MGRIPLREPALDPALGQYSVRSGMRPCGLFKGRGEMADSIHITSLAMGELAFQGANS